MQGGHNPSRSARSGRPVLGQRQGGSLPALRQNPGLLAYLPQDVQTSRRGRPVQVQLRDNLLNPAPAALRPVGNLDEHWDIYYQRLLIPHGAYLLHSTLHSRSYWHRNTWWFPQAGMAEGTISMFSPSREPAENDVLFYDFHLPNGTVVKDRTSSILTIRGSDNDTDTDMAPGSSAYIVMFRYVGQMDSAEAWLLDYVGYNLTYVTVDMRVIGGF
ncbi:hypothetical protein IAR55_001822 [Kwoniella newhampshirensis]|uniref:Uncharacterized protein n=1 Tax=Kwoniella newhampshirensis TaxID=1651941 RepID=A0AAW0Z363_9TREE